MQSVNKEISPARAGNSFHQHVQGIHVAMTSCLLQAANLIDDLCLDSDTSFNQANKKQVEEAKDKLRDTLLLSGKTNELITKHRRTAFKPSIPSELKGILDLPAQPDNLLLFGDNLQERLADIRKQNLLKQEFFPNGT